MVTFTQLGKFGRFGNQLFQIASTIGTAISKRQLYAFPEWEYQSFFVNPLPKLKTDNYINLEGYMQDHRNFEHCKDIVKHYFKMHELLGYTFKNAVFIHYRDYETEGVSSAHPVPTKEYYDEARKYFKDVRFFLFSDNIEKARQIVGYDVTALELPEMEAFYLMSHCQGGIISNSTFSWWAGYLSGGRVVAPLNWFGGRKKSLDTEGLYLPNWIKI